MARVQALMRRNIDLVSRIIKLPTILISLSRSELTINKININARPRLSLILLKSSTRIRSCCIFILTLNYNAIVTLSKLVMGRLKI
ncbi:hypothetical protein [Sodalis endosymbiont of Henestaris halophilus]|uniref:hypothetical protein n=1 Tax=Sodalis endosymbiont of Henestaris halophilus TaxID=1929246 RepID=UPI000BE32D36|nr:hypothetical protein [Sodalis endosymbiont of Henestaris halophilus]